MFDTMYISGVVHVPSISDHHMALFAGVFFMIRAMLALLPALLLRDVIKKCATTALAAAPQN